MSRAANLDRVLHALATGQAGSADVARRAGLTLNHAQKALSYAVAHELADSAAIAGEKQRRSYRLTPLGRQRVGAGSDLAAPGGAAGAAIDVTALLEKIAATAEGMTSDELGARFGVGAAEIDAMLALSVTMGQLVAANVERDGRACTLYRTDVGSARHAAWLRSGAQVRQHALGDDDGEDEPAAASADKPALTWPPLPMDAVAGALVDEATVAELAAVVGGAAVAGAADAPASPAQALQSPPLPPMRLPVLECDIDAAHGPRTQPGGVDDEPEFLCALYSDGRLWITSNGSEVTLPLEHTRQLAHYLDTTLGGNTCGPVDQLVQVPR